jgi:hypothetical protein
MAKLGNWREPLREEVGIYLVVPVLLLLAGCATLEDRQSEVAQSFNAWLGPIEGKATEEDRVPLAMHCFAQRRRGLSVREWCRVHL